MAKALFSKNSSGSDSNYIGIVSTSDWSTAESLVDTEKTSVIEISDSDFNNYRNGTSYIQREDGGSITSDSEAIANETQEDADKYMEDMKAGHKDAMATWIATGRTYKISEATTWHSFLESWDTSAITWPTDKTFEQYLESISQDYVSPLQLCL